MPRRPRQSTRLLPPDGWVGQAVCRVSLSLERHSLRAPRAPRQRARSVYPARARGSAGPRSPPPVKRARAAAESALPGWPSSTRIQTGLRTAATPQPFRTAACRAPRCRSARPDAGREGPLAPCRAASRRSSLSMQLPRWSIRRRPPAAVARCRSPAPSRDRWW